MPIVLDPVTPALLPSTLADQYQTASYIVVAGFSVRVPFKQHKNSRNSI
jgi:hypothetical protein